MRFFHLTSNSLVCRMPILLNVNCGCQEKAATKNANETVHVESVLHADEINDQVFVAVIRYDCISNLTIK